VRRNGFKTARPVARLREGRTDWYRIENNASGSMAKVYIYDEIGYVGVFDGVAIYNSIHDHDATVTVIVDGIAASAASFIAQAGDKIIMNRNSTMMIHDAHGLAIGNSKDMAELAGLLDKASDNIASIYAERSGLSAEHWREAMRAETWYSADEAVEARLADEVRGKTEKAPARNDFDLTVFSYAGREQAPAPVIETPEVVPVETPVAGINWQSITDALQGAFK
jgi:ATP-dependent protease ClpP protease subunit